ncbi:multiple sugar transport system permease protein [Nocardioides sp. BE266]|uniref:carbohydrate ABC transporter permease n=1 Tax=Nocardioides sp. BE266 TaxID=2817725 RepID=UPI00286706D7|nr:sugar ABC transporter permease [Nocardioides sp. BE266]MDR7251601.1 multiple sugar transport system permease protein [Nocardioides sp. BE266]
MSRTSSIRAGQARAGWLFVSPTLVVLGLFLAVPVLMALWVSFTDWNGRGSPFASGVGFVGADNYRELVGEQGGLTRADFMTSLRNNFYYVLLVVPLQTALALFLALVLNQKMLKAVGFFRTAFYFPSVVSSVAISLVFLFLFTGGGVVNTMLGWVGLDGPTWFNDSRGLLHLLGDGLGLWSISDPPSGLVDGGVLGLTWWQWLSGPSVALSVIIFLVVWTTTGTFMLMFLAALQDLPVEVEEAAMIDGAGRWGVFRNVTLPHLRPTMLLVTTLGLIGTWQVFDQVYVMTQGGPGKTTLTPAFLSYFYAFENQKWGVAAAMAFVLFLIIFAMASFQRWLFRDKDQPSARRARDFFARQQGSHSGTEAV